MLQDVHWYDGLIGGAFQGYTLGNIMSGLFVRGGAGRATRRSRTEIRAGPVRHAARLAERTTSTGMAAKFTAAELVQRVTGGPLTIEPYVRYLRGKYGELYRL